MGQYVHNGQTASRIKPLEGYVRIIKIESCRDCPYIRAGPTNRKQFLCKHQNASFNDCTIIQRWCILEPAIQQTVQMDAEEPCRVENKWVETNGEEPEVFESTEYAWVRWDSDKIELTTTWGLFEWSRVTHYMPAPEIREPKPPKIA